MISSSLMRMRGGFIIQEGFVSRFRDGKGKGEGGAAVLADFQRAANLPGQVADHAQAHRTRLVPVEARWKSDAVVLHRKQQLARCRRLQTDLERAAPAIGKSVLQRVADQ